MFCFQSTAVFFGFDVMYAMARQEAIVQTKIVANAFIVGLTPILTFEKTIIGSVVEPGPVRKLAITRSSRDSVNAKSQPVRIDLVIIGSFI
ncbi:hypothetical protein FACS1894113_4600 [Alphaproteobacteria bacterium]|nr:hypothetical protein FACS1894113_4600 [Alphaproteobacteria bacterium]